MGGSEQHDAGNLDVESRRKERGLFCILFFSPYPYD